MDAKPPVIGAYKVEGKVDYDLFAKQYGLKAIDADLEKKIEKYAGNTPLSPQGGRSTTPTGSWTG